jgi:predicted RNA-binding protein with PUA domain
VVRHTLITRRAPVQPGHARETFNGDIDVIDETTDQATGQELNTYENEEIPEVIITEG